MFNRFKEELEKKVREKKEKEEREKLEIDYMTKESEWMKQHEINMVK